MTEDSKSFDLIGALSGVSYPEETFPIYFNAKAAQEVTQLNREWDAADPTTEDFKEKEKAFRDRVEEFKSSEYKVTIRGISKEHHADAMATLLKEAETLSKKGSPLAVDQFLEYRTPQVLWSQYIVKVEAPDGAVRAPLTLLEATEMYNKLPDPARDEVERQIGKMQKDTSSGYEIGISDFDFLSVPSPEE